MAFYFLIGGWSDIIDFVDFIDSKDVLMINIYIYNNLSL